MSNKKTVEQNNKSEQHKVWYVTLLMNWTFLLQVYEITEEKFFEPIKDEYILSLSKMGMAELDDGYNPGTFFDHGFFKLKLQDQRMLMDRWILLAIVWVI